MSSEERRKILEMVEAGRISAEQAASLMSALDEEADGAPTEMDVIQTGSGPGFGGGEAPEFAEVRARARRFAMIPLWAGVFLTVLSAWGAYAVLQRTGISFWFFCLLLPLLLGVLLIALGAGGQGTRWLYVNVDRRHAHDGPRNITVGFPLPLGLAGWFLRHFGHYLRGIQNTKVDEIIQILDATGKSGAPLIINANDGADGEHVQVYIG